MAIETSEPRDRNRGRLHVAQWRPLDLFSRSCRQLLGIRRAAHLGARLMPLLTKGTRLVVASHNPGKVWEINQLLAPYGLNAVSAGDLGLSEPEETETTFQGNARLKAIAAAEGSGLPSLADDSGLEIDCLDGAPGIYSARWAGPGKDFGVAMKKVADEITARNGWGLPGPRANFVSALCLAWPDGEVHA